MSDTVKLIIEIPTDVYRKVHKHKSCIITTKQDDQEIIIGVRKGILLDDVKAEIEKLNPVDYGSMFSYESHNGAKDMQIDVLQILDNIGKEREEKVNGKNE